MRHDRHFHALRPAVRPDGRRRETVCGLLVNPMPGKWFNGVEARACRTCRAIVTMHPLRYSIEPSNELARLRALIDEAVEDRLEPAAALRWLWANAPARGGQAPDAA